MKRVDAEILTVDDLAELFACDKETAAARLTSGDLPGIKVGRGWIIPRQALFERLNEKAKQESVARRAKQISAFKEAQEYCREAKAMKKPSSGLVSATPLPATTQIQRGRKRRIPPSLPSLAESR